METKTLAVGTTLKGKYTVTRLVAGGGMAWLYEVEETRADGSRQVWAMKELRADSDDTRTLAESRQLFEQEANLLVHLSHPNLPIVCAFFQEAGRSYLVMEFVRGESLEKRLLGANAPLLEGDVLDYAIQIAGVLAYLHSRPEPVIFRDMKPSNVMLTLDGRIKLIDFGIARTYKVGKRKDTITMGSENYAAPEQWGKAQTDPRADIYGLGATMYHLLTNVPPLPTFVPTPRVPIQQYNPAVSDKTVAVVDKAMETDREKRFVSALMMREALLDCLSKRDRQRIEARERPVQGTVTTGAPASTTPRPATNPTVVASQPASRPPALPTQGQAVARPVPQSAPQQAPATQRASPPQAAQSQQVVRVSPVAVPSPSAAGPQPYTKPCPRCATLSQPAARFCRHCGHMFVAPLPPVLAMIQPIGARWEYPLRTASCLIGRQGGDQPVDLDIGFYDPEGYISRNHARINVEQRRYLLTDLGSSNGTYVNEQKLAPGTPRMLANGDQIRLGRVVMVFRIR